MIGVILGLMLATQILGNQDYNVEILDPRTVMKEGEGREKNQSPSLLFSFSLSSMSIDFGLIRPTNPVIRENTIGVLMPSGFSYSLIGFEDHPLRAAPFKKGAAQDIPDTACDNGTCRETVESLWVNPLAFGFGFSRGQDRYRQFANDEAGEVKQSIFTHNKIIFKVNVAKTQPAGVYTNTITYILVPTF